MSSLDLTFNEFCPNCRKEMEFETDFYIFNDEENSNDYLKHTCEHCGAELDIKASIYIEKSSTITVIRTPNPDYVEDEPYHSNDPAQLSLL